MSSVEAIDLSVCVDCLLILAHGEAPADWDTDRSAEWERAVAERWPVSEGWRLVPGSCGEDGQHCETFSRSSCDGCGSALAGDRHVAHAVRDTP